MKLLRIIYRNFLTLLDHLIAGLPRHRTFEGKRVVLITRLDRLGDFVLWTSSASTLRTIFPQDEYRIILLANASWSDLAAQLNFWDEVWSVNVEQFLFNPIYRFVTGLRIKRSFASIAINPRVSSHSFLDDSVVRLASAPKRIGCEQEESPKPAFAVKWYTEVISIETHLSSELEKNAYFVRKLGAASFSTQVPHLDLRVDASHRLFERYLVVSPGASHPGRRWPLEKFSELLSKVYGGARLPMVVVGTRQERHLLAKPTTVLDKHFIDLCGETTCLQLAEVLAHSTLVITNESGTAHLSSALGVPTVCILGGGHFGRFLPYPFADSNPIKPIPHILHKPMACFNCDWKCIYHVPVGAPYPCVEDINLSDVLKVIETALSANVENRGEQ